MKTKIKKHRVGVISLGCSKNLVDSELLLKQLQLNNIEFVHDPSDITQIDTAIINTCGFIHDARQESVDTILQMIQAKEQNIIKDVFVMGCLSERYKNDLKAEIPEVDAFFGVNDLKGIIAYLGGQYKNDLLGDRLITTPSHYAYLKIAEGCDRHCSFCAIPAIRGAHASRPMEEILQEATNLVAQGVKEVNLISQETTYYGLDLYKKRLLPELLNSLASIRGLEWMRLHYTYPLAFPAGLLDVIKHHHNICNYLDIPLQHINDRILKSMQRGTSSYSIRKLLDQIRLAIPNIAVRTTFIVGYPGETEKEYRELLNFIEESRFDRLGIFPYSHEEGTSAYSLKNSVSQQIKQQRVEEIMALQEGISLSMNRERVGKVMRVMVDRREGDYFIGRTQYDSPEVDNEVLIRSVVEKKIEPGSFYDVKIISAESFDLYAELI